MDHANALPADIAALIGEVGAVKDPRTAPVVKTILGHLQRERRFAADARQHWLDTVDALRDPLMVHDQNGRITRCNKAYAEKAGLKPAEAIGKHYWECFPLGQLNLEQEGQFELATGEIYLSRSFRVGNGDCVECLHLFEDVTEARHAAEEMERSERRFRALINGSSDVIYVIDAQGLVRYRSASGERLLGRPDSQVLGASVMRDLHYEDAAKAREALARSLANPGAEVRLDTRVQRSDGHWLDVEIIGRNLLHDPAVAGIVLDLRDVTARKQAEDKARRLNRVYAVLSGINHVIATTRDRRELFDAACRIAVEEGQFISAAIAMHEEKAERLVAVAQHGAFQGFAPEGLSTRADSPYAMATAVRAVRERQVICDDDLLANIHAGPNRKRNVDAGARAMISLPLLSADRVFGVLVLFAHEAKFFDAEEVKLLRQLTGDVTRALESLENAERIKEYDLRIRRGLQATVEAIASALESRDPYTAGHQKRVADLAVAIAREMGLPESELVGIRFGALIHDLGKIQVPSEILSKPGKLSKLEFELIKTHPQAGYDIIKGIEFPWPVAAMVHQHHERIDGSGYPQGLKGEAIALEARILAVADVVEAMASHRPYRPGLGIDRALSEIQSKRGQWFCEKTVDACTRLFREKGFRLEDQGK
jgi:PAS domain S-box-containing protein/putative nucleotidyltransferase with HDIG domain